MKEREREREERDREKGGRLAVVVQSYAFMLEERKKGDMRKEKWEAIM